jgi:hypothetical protein
VRLLQKRVVPRAEKMENGAHRGSNSVNKVGTRGDVNEVRKGKAGVAFFKA